MWQNDKKQNGTLFYILSFIHMENMRQVMMGLLKTWFCEDYPFDNNFSYECSC